VEAFQRQGKDISKSTHQEMRSLVCAQCHVEYYFKGKEDKYLTFPWDKGFNVEDIEKYYDEYEFTDWTHKLSRTPMLKAQHPDFELFQMGIHSQRGLSCVDCHMPFKSEGGIKFTDHHVQSPLNNIANSCQVCHRESENTLRNNVYDRQDKVFELNKIFNVLNDDPLCLFLRKSNVGFLDNPVEETKSEFKTNLEEFEIFEIFSL